MKTTFKSCVLGLLLYAISFGQIVVPYNYQNKTPSPNAPSGGCFINTTPVYNYLLGTYWFCVPNTSAPFNLGTWTSYTPPNGVVAMNAAGTISLATSAQIAAIGIGAASLATATGLPLTTGVTGLLPVTNGGTGAASLSGVATQSIVIPLTLTQLQTLFSVGVQILPAPAATSMYMMGPCTLNLTRGSAAFTGGGAVSIGYGATFASTTPSPLTHGTIASTVFTTFAASHGVVVIPAAVAVTATTGLAGLPVFMSAATQDFASGTGASGQISCQYSVVTGVS